MSYGTGFRILDLTICQYCIISRRTLSFTLGWSDKMNMHRIDPSMDPRTLQPYGRCTPELERLLQRMASCQALVSRSLIAKVSFTTCMVAFLRDSLKYIYGTFIATVVSYSLSGAKNFLCSFLLISSLSGICIQRKGCHRSLKLFPALRDDLRYCVLMVLSSNQMQQLLMSINCQQVTSSTVTFRNVLSSQRPVPRKMVRHRI